MTRAARNLSSLLPSAWLCSGMLACVGDTTLLLAVEQTSAPDSTIEDFADPLLEDTAGPSLDDAGSPPQSSPEVTCGQAPLSLLEVSTQEQLEQLAGCTHFVGRELRIDVFDGLDLAPVADLAVVDGLLRIQSTQSDATFSTDLTPLSSLRRVEALELSGLRLNDFSAFAGLSRARRLVIDGTRGPTSLEGFEDLVIESDLSISDTGGMRSTLGIRAPARMSSINIADEFIQDLTGFEGVVECDWLDIDAPIDSLEQLAGLRSIAVGLSLRRTRVRDLSPLGGLQELGSLSLQEAPELSTLDGLFIPSRLESILVRATAIEEVNALSSLRSAGSLWLDDNPNLRDLSGVAAISELGELSITGSAALERLPTFAELTEMQSLELVNDSALLAVGPVFPGLERVSSYVQIVYNERLESVTGLASLREADTLRISNNPALTQVTLNSLERVQVLDLSCNPQLSNEELEPVAEATKAPSVHLAGNLGSDQICMPRPL